ncbi:MULTISPECIES: GNAT family N-acetyltransferase [unclassified Ruegeria]|uniref:GNAT family N-acetyltransferase n=1 Tax=unclassified Ruegeria TaxID=2625375 RepID=UPI001ADC23E1|nr:MULTISPECIES: GNAT family N-acetyltransferase [unclassified Ruegeria]MBO9412669.1 GNAT family N-acetyltransferase [Ruegeria sp. R8_1]MBO9416783.1 GNAT family N-acetyltransferase [Ruegeria sp. R8_2]
MTAIRFANATQKDTTAITNCIKAAYFNAREYLTDLPDVTAGIDRDIAENRVVMAVSEDRLAGVIIFARQGAEMKVFNLAVSPKAQGQGIAGKLLARAEAEAREAGCTLMVLRTHRLMQDTRAIYAHLGWIETEVSGNSVAMQKTLEAD